MLDDVIKELKELHGEDLDFSKHHYYLFCNDGILNVYLDVDDETLKIDVTFSDDVKIYHLNKNLEDLL